MARGRGILSDGRGTHRGRGVIDTPHAGEAFDSWSRREKETAYYLLLIAVLLTYVWYFGHVEGMGAYLEDAFNGFASILLQKWGLTAYAIMFLVICRCTSDARKAFMLGVGLIFLAALCILLKFSVLPSDYLPLWTPWGTEFSTPPPDVATNTTTTTTPESEIESDVHEQVDGVVGFLHMTWRDIYHLFGFLTIPLMFFFGFCCVLWTCKLHTGRVIFATLIVATIGIVLFFKVLVYDKEHPLEDNSNATTTTNITTTTTNITTTDITTTKKPRRPKKPKELATSSRESHFRNNGPAFDDLPDHAATPAVSAESQSTRLANDELTNIYF